MPHDRLSLLGDVGFLLPVPEVEEEQDKDEGEGVDGHRAVVEKGEKFAHDVAGVPLHQVDGLKKHFGHLSSVVNLVKHFTIVIYDSRVVLTRKLPIL